MLETDWGYFCWLGSPESVKYVSSGGFKGELRPSSLVGMIGSQTGTVNQCLHSISLPFSHLIE